MAKTREQKQKIIDFYKNKLANAKGIYFISSQGISAIDASNMKKDLYDSNSYYHVLKNRLFQIALKDSGYDIQEEIKTGQQAVVFASEEGITDAAKVLKNYINDHEETDLRLGILYGKYITVSQINELADLPTKDEMIGRVLATINAPLTGFVNVLAGNVKSILYVLTAIKEQKL